MKRDEVSSGIRCSSKLTKPKQYAIGVPNWNSKDSDWSWEFRQQWRLSVWLLSIKEQDKSVFYVCQKLDWDSTNLMPSHLYFLWGQVSMTEHQRLWTRGGGKRIGKYWKKKGAEKEQKTNQGFLKLLTGPQDPRFLKGKSFWVTSRSLLHYCGSMLTEIVASIATNIVLKWEWNNWDTTFYKTMSRIIDLCGKHQLIT